MIYDIIIVGGGPAGATAGIYGARAGKKVLVLEKEIIGGRITESPKVENIPGYLEISGAEFGSSLDEQLERAGATITYEEVIDVSINGNLVNVKTEYDTYSGKSLIIATGTKNRLLGLPNEEELIGKGISFCVTCDGLFYKDLDVAVVGGGNTAVTVALELSGICKTVSIIQNLIDLSAEEKLVNELKTKSNIKYYYLDGVQEYITDGEKITGLKLNSGLELNVGGVFLAIGQIPNNKIFENVVELDGRGYIKSSKYPNIFSCGDCNSKSIQQVAVAVGSGVEAVTKAIKYLDDYDKNKEELRKIILSYPSMIHEEYGDEAMAYNFANNLTDWLIQNGIEKRR